VQIFSDISKAFKLNSDMFLKQVAIISIKDLWFDVMSFHTKHQRKNYKCGLDIHEQVKINALTKMLDLFNS
jgi:hypothetical protein